MRNTLFGFLFLGQTTLAANEFIDLATVDSTILHDIRYATMHQFVGMPIPGYNAPKCYLSRPAARALHVAQNNVRQKGYSLKVYDCYRPQRAVQFFVRWAKDLGDNKMKGEFYPNVEKKNLFRDGYIAERSGHNRGSTIDVTLVSLPAASQEEYQEGDPLRDCRLPAAQRFGDNSVDMGTGYDCFDPLAHTSSPAISPEQLSNRMLLKSELERVGFVNYDKEWWHFTLRNEPYPSGQFDDPIE